MTERDRGAPHQRFDSLTGLPRENAPVRVASLAEQLADARERLLGKFTDHLEQSNLARFLVSHIGGRAGRAECEEVLKRYHSDSASMIQELVDGLARIDEDGFSLVHETFKNRKNESVRMVCFRALMAQNRPECDGIRSAGLLDQNKAIREIAVFLSARFLSRANQDEAKESEVRELLIMLESYGDIDPPRLPSSEDITAVQLVAQHASAQMLSELRGELATHPQSARGDVAMSVITTAARPEDVRFLEELARKGSAQVAVKIAERLRGAVRLAPQNSALWSPVAEALLERMHAESASPAWIPYLMLLNDMGFRVPPQFLAALMERRMGGSNFWSDMSAKLPALASDEIASVACNLIRPRSTVERIRQWFRLRELKNAVYSGVGRSELSDEIERVSAAVRAIAAGNLKDRSAMLERGLSHPFAKVRLEAALALGPSHEKAVKALLAIPEHELKIGGIGRALAFLGDSNVPAAQERVWEEISSPSNAPDINNFARDFLAERLAIEPVRAVEVMKALIASRNNLSISRVVIGALRTGGNLPSDLRDRMINILSQVASTSLREIKAEIESLSSELTKS